MIPQEDATATRSFEDLVATGRVLLDQDDQLSDYLRMDVAPAVVTVEAGVATRAAGISTVRQLRKLLPDAIEAQETSAA